MLVLASVLVAVLVWLDGKQAARLDRMDSRMGRIEAALEEVRREQGEQGERIAKIEERLDILLPLPVK